MRNITLLTGTILFLPMTTMAQSINCTPSPDCASLGYTESSCPDGAGVKCPWGNTWFCTEEKCDTSYQYTCSGTGYAGGSGDECGGKYKSSATDRPKIAISVIFCTATEPAALKIFPTKPPSPSSSIKAPTAIAPRLWH